MVERLFVCLKKEPFLDFKKRGKQYELRRYERGFTEKFVFRGRRVELRLGYSGESLWGEIGDVVVGTLEEIFAKVDYNLLAPQAESCEAAISADRELLGDAEKFIAFQILLDGK